MQRVGDKSGQVTIFIIAGIVIVAIIILFFLLRSNVIPSPLGSGNEKNPQQFLQSCLEDKMHEGISLIEKQGGNINPQPYKEFKFQEESQMYKLTYLCYTQSYYQPCVNQQPVLLSHIENEIKKYTEETANDCFDSLIKSYKDAGYTVIVQGNEYEVTIGPKRVSVNFPREIILTKSGTEKINKFTMDFNSKIYELATVAQEISMQEGRFCSFSSEGYMAFYKDYIIREFRTSDSIKIYDIKFRNSDEYFRFGVRGCVVPPGFG